MPVDRCFSVQLGMSSVDLQELPPLCNGSLQAGTLNIVCPSFKGSLQGDTVVKSLQPPSTCREDSCSLNFPQILPVAGDIHVIQGVRFNYVSFVTTCGKREPMLKHFQFLVVLRLNYQCRGLQKSSYPVSSICALNLSESLDPVFYSLCIFLLNGFFMLLLLSRWLKGNFSWQHNLLFERFYYCCLLKGFSILPGDSNLF